jgi:hypothetical protein
MLLDPFWDVYRPFADKLTIPENAKRRLAEFTVTEDEIVHLVVEKELEHSRYIYLEDSKIIFDEYTDPPHGEIIGEIMGQIWSQDRAGGRLFVSGTGNRKTHFIYDADIKISL